MERGKRPLSTRTKLAVALVLATAACSLTTSLDGLQDGGSATPDGGADVFAVEAGPDPDTGSDAAPSPPDPCDATFCDFFDDAGLGASWTSIDGADAGWMSLGPPAFSPPNAFVSDMPDDPDTTRNIGRLVKTFKNAKTVRCSFMIDPETPSVRNFSDIFSFQFDDTKYDAGVEYVSMWLSLDDNGLWTREDVNLPGGGCDCPLFSTDHVSIPSKTWTRVDMVTDFQTMTLSVNGSIVSSHAMKGQGPVDVDVALGQYQFAANPSLLRFDDLKCLVTK
ncbi:MAG TPA: hypothetical protein VF407_10750 [Polyangiaceae bacterium]